MMGNVRINVIKNPETVVVGLLLMWAYRPTMEFAPSYGDVFKLPSMMDDQHVRIGRFMKHDPMKDYKVLMRRKFNLQAFTKESAGRNRATFDFYLRFRGRNAKYIQFKEGATTGYYSDCFVETQCFPEVVVESALDGDDVVRIEVGSDGGMVAIVLASEMYERCAAAFEVISPASDSFDLVSFRSRVMNQALRSVQDLRPAFSSLSRKSL
ncbi:hypothetical protein Ancab_015018 [Ancistrocladus abbreviatus]